MRLRRTARSFQPGLETLVARIAPSTYPPMLELTEGIVAPPGDSTPVAAIDPDREITPTCPTTTC